MMNTREKKITIPYQHKENVYITKKKKKKYSNRVCTLSIDLILTLNEDLYSLTINELKDVIGSIPISLNSSHMICP